MPCMPVPLDDAGWNHGERDIDDLLGRGEWGLVIPTEAEVPTHRDPEKVGKSQGGVPGS